jgi:hypothetical protein
MGFIWLSQHFEDIQSALIVTVPDCPYNSREESVQEMRTVLSPIRFKNSQNPRVYK